MGVREAASVQAELGVGKHPRDAAVDQEGGPHNAAVAYGPHGVEGNNRAVVGTVLTGARVHALWIRVPEAQTRTMGAEAQTRMTGVAGGTH